MASLIGKQLGSRRHGDSRDQRPATATAWPAEMGSMGSWPHPTTAAQLGLRHAEKVDSNTCGYPVDDDAVPSFTCDGGDTCAVSSGHHVIGCCPPDQINSCVLKVACVELGPVLDLSPDDGDDPSETLSCGPGANPYCATYTYATDDDSYGGYSAFSCATAHTIITVRGYSVPGDSTTTSKGPSTTTSAPTSSRGLSTRLDPSSTSETLTHSLGPASSRGLPTGLDSSSTSETSTPSPGFPNVGTTDPVDNNNQLPAGTIAGSVVGGAAGIALLAAGILFVVLRTRKKNRKAEAQAEKPEEATVPSPTSGGHGEGKDLFPLMAAPPSMIAGQQPGHASGPVSPHSHHTDSSGVPDQPVSPVQEDETAANREGRETPGDTTGRRAYSMHNRPPSSRYHAYNPVSGGPVELPATTVHEME